MTIDLKNIFQIFLHRLFGFLCVCVRVCVWGCLPVPVFKRSESVWTMLYMHNTMGRVSNAL